MYKLLSLSLLFTITFNNVYSQQDKQRIYLDSLLSVLPATKEDTNRVLLACEIGNIYCYYNPDSGIAYATLALQLAEKLKWEAGLGNAYKIIGYNYLTKSDYPRSLDSYISCLKVSEKLGNKRSEASALMSIGNIYKALLDFPKALECYQKSLAIFTTLKREGGMTMNLNNIGAVYFEQKDYDKSLEYHFRALKINEKRSDKEGIAFNYGNIAVAYSSMNKHPEALEYNFKSRQLFGETGFTLSIARSLANIGSEYHSIVKDPNHEYLEAQFSGNQKKALYLARIYLDSALVIARELGNLEMLQAVYLELSEVQTKTGDITTAFENYKNYSTTKDSIFNIEKDKKLTQTTMQYEFDKKEAAARAEQEKKDAIAEQELRRQKLVRNGFMGGFAVVFLFAGIFFTQRNKIKKGKRRSDELLLNILPEEVAEELKAKGSADAKHFDEVTVMFTDFKGFTQISEKLSPTELVTEIHTCFKAFDNIIAKHNIEKIKTIGDSYMCAGGLPVANTTHATDVVNAAIEIQKFMQEYLQQRKTEGKEVFEIRIGIHTGPVVAGIVGVKKFAYDIWGDTVNIASRMESSGEAGKVNISGSTYELVKDKFNCVHRGKIQAKNKGEIDMYFVEIVS